MSEDNAVDIVGVGRAIEAIPPDSWNRLVNTACDIVESVVAPVTQTSGGLGRLIKAKFDRLVEVEKVLAAEAVASAQRKAKESGLNNNQPRPKILLQVIEKSATEADSDLRELWSNLLANEMVGATVHPEIGRILDRLSFEDAQLLVEIAEEEPNRYTELFKQAIKLALVPVAFPLAVSISLDTDSKTFNHAHLQNLGLIFQEDGRWKLTVLGEGFIGAVTDPTLKAVENT